MRELSHAESAVLARLAGTSDSLAALIRDAACLGEHLPASPEAVNLLAAAAIPSLEELSKWEGRSEEVTELLREVNEREAMLPKAPAVDTVGKWLEAARQANSEGRADAPPGSGSG